MLHLLLKSGWSNHPNGHTASFVRFNQCIATRRFLGKMPNDTKGGLLTRPLLLYRRDEAD